MSQHLPVLCHQLIEYWQLSLKYLPLNYQGLETNSNILLVGWLHLKYPTRSHEFPRHLQSLLLWWRWQSVFTFASTSLPVSLNFSFKRKPAVVIKFLLTRRLFCCVMNNNVLFRNFLKQNCSPFRQWYVVFVSKFHWTTMLLFERQNYTATWYRFHVLMSWYETFSVFLLLARVLMFSLLLA